MTKNVFIWVAHPRAGSLCSGLADAYQAGAVAKGAQVRRMDLGDMRFEAEFEGYGKDTKPLTADLQEWQENIRWADHILIVHPYWWGSMPTKAKAVLDIALAPGFAYKYHKRGVAWDKLLAGKTGDAIITSDTPPLLDTLLYRKPGRRVIRNQVMKFCGIKPRHIRQLGSVKLASPAKIARWLTQAETMGARAAA
ncbi:MAG: NAD(P)H-dependent oxidoreductase [Pseudomonadota bacterium]